jgi:hypothetical protein
MDGASVGQMSGHDPRNGRFTSGNSERAAKRNRIAKRLAELVEVYESDAASRQILSVAAAALDDASNGRTLITRIRAANSARRLLASVPRKPQPRQPDALDAFLARKADDE